MKRPLRWRFWVEATSALLSTALFLVTVTWSNWIELVFKIDPDHGGGSAEGLVLASSLAASAVFITAAHRERARCPLSA